MNIETNDRNSETGKVRKIVLGAGWYFPESAGGTEKYVKLLASGLRGRGYEPVIIAPLHGRQITRYVHDQIPVIRYPIPDQPGREEARSIVPHRYFEQYVDILRELRPDVLHLHTVSWAMGIHHVKAAKEMGIATLVTTHTAGLGYLCPRGTGMIWGKKACDGLVKPLRCGACLLQNKGLPRGAAAPSSFLTMFFAWILKTFARRSAVDRFSMPHFVQDRLGMHKELLRYTDAIVTLTEWGKEILIRNGAERDKIVLCRLGVSDGLGARRPVSTKKSGESSALTVGYIGRIDPIKGLDYLIRAVRRVAPEKPLRLSIHGISNTDDPYLRDLRRLAGADARIVFYPAADEGDLPDVLAQFDVLAVPSVCMEGGPTILLEAMACGVPVIGSGIGAIPEYVHHEKNGLIFNPADAEGIVAVLRRLISDPALVGRLKAGIGETRTMSLVVEDTANLYARLRIAKCGGRV